MYKAIGQFKCYSRGINIVSALNFVSYMMLLLIIKSDNAYLYVLGYVIVDYFMLFVLTIKFSKIFNSIKICIFEFNELISNLKEGILLLFGNFSSIILISMDRWFTKILLTTIIGVISTITFVTLLLVVCFYTDVITLPIKIVLMSIALSVFGV